MLVYLALLVVICLDFLIEYFLNKKGLLTKNTKLSKFLNFIFKFRFISIAGMGFLSTFRALSVGGDVMFYNQYYSDPMLYDYYFNFELGYKYLNYLFVYHLKLNVKFLFCLISLFVSVCLVLFINKFSSNKLMSLLLFVMFGIFGQSLSALRQFIAMGFVLLSMMFIADKKIWRCIIFICCACLFHISAALCFIIIPIRYIKFNHLWLLISIFAVLIFSFGLPFILKAIESLIPSFNYYTKYYIKNTSLFVPTNLFNILYSLGMIAIFVVLYMARFKWFKNELESDNYYTFFLSLFLIVPLIRIAGFIVGLEALLNRINMYFFFLLIILVPKFLSCFKKFNHSEWLVAITYIAALVYMILIYTVHDSCSVTPYIFWF